tara:strand:- start:173 stop:901 length:729 start_codon:yes stop_codon:yes gene_type:complete
MMGVFGTSNGQIASQINDSQTAQFKAVNNLLTLQENHVEEFFEYHGVQFLTAFEQLIEDVVERVVSQQLKSLKFNTASTGEIVLHADSEAAYNNVSDANLQLDIQNLLAAAVNTEVILQRRMAKQQYLETKGFSAGAAAPMQSQLGQPAIGQPAIGQPSNIQGQAAFGGVNSQIAMQQQAFNPMNQSGYPIPPAGYDQMNNPYWIDPATGQPSYTPPQSGLGLGSALVHGASKAAAWAKWLA